MGTTKPLILISNLTFNLIFTLTLALASILTLLFSRNAMADVDIVYTWSPMMPLSIEGIEEMQAICDKNQFNCKFILDPYLDQNNIDPILQKYISEEGLSEELILKGALNNYPAIAVMKDGQLMGNIHLGYLEPITLEKLLLKRLK